MTIRGFLRSNGYWVVIDRVEKANALDYEHLVSLKEEIEIGCGSDAVAVVVRGAGDRYFSAGIDLGEVASVEGFEDAWRLMYEGLGGVCRALLSCRKPVIAAVNGHAVGIGFELLYASDIAFAVRYAKLGSPAVRWGMVPPGSTTIAPLIVGAKRAAWVALTGELMSAEEAARHGFITGVVDDVDELDAKVEEALALLAKAEPWALVQARRLLQLSRAEQLLEAGLRTLASSTARAETRARAKSFLEKREKRRG